MAKHEVNMKVPTPVEVGNTNVEFVIRSDDSKFGTLRLSRGGVDWVPVGNAVTHYAMSWEKLADVMQSNGTKKKS